MMKPVVSKLLRFAGGAIAAACILWSGIALSVLEIAQYSPVALLGWIGMLLTGLLLLYGITKEPKAMSGNEISPEYRELHEIYCRCAEINGRLLAHAEEYLDSPLFAELLGAHAGLGNYSASVLILIQTRVATDPKLFETWKEASRKL